MKNEGRSQKGEVRTMRQYSVHATRGHHKASVYIRGDWISYWESRMRIRQFTIVIFRSIFGGLEPTFHYHIDGNLAAARDDRGNEVYVDQTNWHAPGVPGQTTMNRPLCPMLLRKEAA